MKRTDGRIAAKANVVRDEISVKLHKHFDKTLEPKANLRSLTSDLTMLTSSIF